MKQWALLKAMKSEKQTSPPSQGRIVTGKEGMEEGKEEEREGGKRKGGDLRL